MKTRIILAMNPAKWLQTANIMATSTTKLTYPIQFVWLARFARLSLKMCLPASLPSIGAEDLARRHWELGERYDDGNNGT